MLASALALIGMSACQPLGTVAPLATPAAGPGTDAATQEWAALVRRPLKLPALAPGAPCPRAVSRTVDPAFAPVLGDGPVYAAGVTDGVLGYGHGGEFAGSDWGG